MSLDHDAIYKAYPNAASVDDSTGAVDASGNSITLEQDKIDTARAELDAEQALVQYKTNRVGPLPGMGVGSTVYPALGEQLDLLYHDMKAGKLGVAATTGDWYVGITSVKLAHPKPS